MRVVARATDVGCAVELHDEALLGACEVDDVRTDDELATEGEAGFGAGELATEPFFSAGRGEAHEASALGEDASLVSRDEMAREHAGPPQRRAPSGDCSRSFRDARSSAATIATARGAEGARFVARRAAARGARSPCSTHSASPADELR